MKKSLLFLAVLMAFGCEGSNVPNSGGTFTGNGNVANNNIGLGGAQRTVVITEPGPIQRDGDVVDSVEVEGFDSSGRQVYGPVTVDFSNQMSIPEPPPTASTLELDYLRNKGLTLFRATVPRSHPGATGFDLDNPEEVAVELPRTGFTIGKDANGAFVVIPELSGPDVDDVRNRALPGLRLKGVCYSPAPINFRNIDAPSIGDLFWDSNQNVKNWFALWGKGPLPYDKTVNGRDDLTKIRGLGCNCIRTYCMISRQIFTFENGNFNAGDIPSPPDKFDHFTHKEFLDACWNNGEQPLYVLVGIPLPPTVLYRYGGATEKEKAFWDFVLRETVADLKDHPAVLGFTLFNEIDENRSAWPGVDEVNITGGTPNADSDFYYGKLQEYSKVIHDITGRDPHNRKLVGWAAHDNRPFVHFASTLPTGNPYFARLTDVDFYGVNTYQSENLNSVVGTQLAGSYGLIPAALQKPVFLTEFGWPATGHRNNEISGPIYEDATTRQKTATVIKRMLPKAFQSQLALGMTYFEFSDEWWKEPPNVATEWNGANSRDGGMPNGFHDQEGFGLYSTALGSGRTSPTQPPTANNRPVTPVDPYFERTELTTEVKNAYSQF